MSMNGGYVIEFDFPEGKAWAAVTSIAWGYAPTTTTAHVFLDKQGAERTLQNAYGEASREYGTVVPK
jgi:hypothetical protein